MTVAAILLAGGESSRMGMPKPLLEWGGRTLIEYQLAQLLASPVDHVVVVLGHRADEVWPLIHRAGVSAVVNELYWEGRASSLRVGAAILRKDTEAVLLLNVDQPRPHSVIEGLVAEHRRRGSLISVPAFQGKRGHPPLLSGSLMGELREVREASQGLRGLMKAHDSEVQEVAFDTEIVLLDVNQPDEYEMARASYFE